MEMYPEDKFYHLTSPLASTPPSQTGPSATILVRFMATGDFQYECCRHWP